MAVHPSELLGPNESFYPPEGADVAPAFCGTLRTAQVRMHTSPELVRPVLDGRDARIFPGITLALFTLGDLLVPVARGRIVRESPGHATPSYWCVIPELGRVWQERADGGWSRAALPLTLVNDTDNEAHQGLAMFLYRQDAVSSMRFQFVQQTAPYLLKQPFLAWGSAPVELVSLAADTETHGAQVKAEIAQRLTALPWSRLRPARLTDSPGQSRRSGSSRWLWCAMKFSTTDARRPHAATIRIRLRCDSGFAR